MKRRLTTALASAALLAFAAATPHLYAGAQTNQGPERTGEKMTKNVQQSCPVHPEFKARTAGKCPKCRAEERKMRGAREKDKNKVNRPQQDEGAAANE